MSSKGHVPNKLKSLGFQKPPAAQPGREHGLDSASVLLGTSPASLSPGCCQTLRAGSLNLSYLRSLPKRCVISELQSHGLAYPEGEGPERTSSKSRTRTAEAVQLVRHLFAHAAEV